MIEFIIYVALISFVAWFTHSEGNNPWIWGGLSIIFTPVGVFILYMILTRLDVISYK